MTASRFIQHDADFQSAAEAYREYIDSLGDSDGLLKALQADTGLLELVAELVSWSTDRCPTSDKHILNLAQRIERRAQANGTQIANRAALSRLENSLPVDAELRVGAA
jgi:hypothetical protein